jgi:hypothetical protein
VWGEEESRERKGCPSLPRATPGVLLQTGHRAGRKLIPCTLELWILFRPQQYPQQLPPSLPWWILRFGVWVCIWGPVTSEHISLFSLNQGAIFPAQLLILGRKKERDLSPASDASSQLYPSAGLLLPAPVLCLWVSLSSPPSPAVCTWYCHPVGEFYIFKLLSISSLVKKDSNLWPPVVNCPVLE